jgi:hypothetical protein
MDDHSILARSAHERGAGQFVSALIELISTKKACLLLLGLLAPALPGCVERRMTIRTNVDLQGGALVYLDNEEVGYSPVSTGFTYYADREIKLVKEGYETVTLIQPIRAPWWDSLLLEFFSENLWPFTLRDERQFHFDLPPAASVSTGEVIQRGQQLRKEAELGAELVPGVRPAAAAAPLGF